VSVIMPVYNCERYLADAVQGILRQTFADFEFIIVDDGSRDSSLSILREFESNDARIRVVSRPNTGIVGALNDGIKHARGQFIARMDGDDVSLPERFERQLVFLLDHPDCVAVGSRVMLIDTDGEPICTMCHEVSHDEIDRVNLEGLSHSMSHPAVMMRAEMLRRIGGYRKPYETAEDIDLYLRLAECGQLANLPEVLLNYRVHASSIGSRQRSTQAVRAWAAIIDARRRRGIPILDGDEALDPYQTPSIPQQHLKWAWWALNDGHIATARKHALRAVRGQPLTPASWRLLYCAMRGR